uniref:Uncharacterized protein n=1 Tax=Schistocephalus solidus TaxID=70667 RepID=A0A0X3NR80_SCHSO
MATNYHTPKANFQEYQHDFQRCFKEFSFHKEPEVILSIVVLGVAVAWFIGSLIIMIKLCCSSSRWPKFFKNFIIFGTVLNLLNAALAGVTAFFLQKNGKIKYMVEQTGFSISFYAILAAGGLHLVTVIMLIFILCCKSEEDSDSQKQEEVSPKFPDAYGATDSNTMGMQVEHALKPNNGLSQTFSSNIQFADWKPEGNDRLYRDYYGTIQSTVFGSA